MFPLYDTIRSRSFPVVNLGIIIANVLIFFYEIALGAHLERFILYYGIVPLRYSNPLISAHFTLYEQLIPFISSQFLHGGWVHLIFNMWFLWIFGDNVEDRMGHFRYLIFYLLCGVIASLIHLRLNFYSDKPAIGASGAIAGVMGAYFLLFPLSRVIVLVPLFFVPFFFELPAFFFLGIWFVMQFFSGYVSLLRLGGQMENIAWWAHVGGFVAGMFLVFFFKKSSRKYRRFYDDEFAPW